MPRTRFLVLFAAFVRLIEAFMSYLATLMAKVWRRLPVHCSHCCRSIGSSSVSPGEQIAWCPHCQRIINVPLLKAPGWVTGVLVILVLNLQ